jgi:hypothetical protein
MAKKKKEETLSDILDRIEDDIATLRDKIEELESNDDLENEEDEDDDFYDSDDDVEEED